MVSSCLNNSSASKPIPATKPTSVHCACTLDVVAVEDRWYSPGETYFRVLTDDGDRYVLRHTEAQDVWTLTAFRAETR